MALVSTYPPARCGIGDYAQALRSALGDELDVTILAERTADAPAVRDVDRVWSRDSDWPSELLTAASSLAADVFHIQHEDGILGRGQAMLRAVEGLRALGKPVVVTPHSVYPKRVAWPWATKLEPSRFHRSLAALGAHFIAHQWQGMGEVLVDHGVPLDQITTIAHGTPVLALPTREHARRVLQLDLTTPLALFFGFIHRRKGIETLARAFMALDPNTFAHLAIVGQLRMADWRIERLRRIIAPGIAAGRVSFRPGFVAADDLPRYMAACDVLCLPHEQRYGSASGVLHNALAAERAVLCSDGPKFAELVERYRADLPELVVGQGDVRGWTRALELLLGSPTVRERATRTTRTLAEQTSWANAAEHHLALYRVCAEQPRAGAQR